MEIYFISRIVLELSNLFSVNHIIYIWRSWNEAKIHKL